MIEPWQLEDYNDSLDTREVTDDEGETTIEIRHHWVFARHRKMQAIVSFSSEVGTQTQLISYNVGSVIKSKNMGGRGAAKYICVSDAIAPEGIPGIYVVERQVWEYYSMWEDAPAGWGV